MKYAALSAIACLGFSLSCLGSARTDLAWADPVGIQGPPRPTALADYADNSPASGAPDAIVPPAAPSLVAEHDAYERGRRLSSTTWAVLATAGALALAWKGVAIFRRRRKAQRLLLQNLYAIQPVEAAAAPTRNVPRCLPTNPYSDPSAPDTLGLQIERAAEASMEFGRVLGVIFFDLGQPPQNEQNQIDPSWVGEVAELVVRLQTCLRTTDHVALVDNREIVVCIALLPGRTELTGIANRLAVIGRKQELFAPAFRVEAGFAIYPLCGYRGDELIDYARADYRARLSSESTAGAPDIERSQSREASESSAAL